MSKTPSLAVRWALIAFASGMITAWFVKPALQEGRSEITSQSASQLISRLTSQVERDFHVLVLPSNTSSEQCQAYLDSNYENVAARLFRAKSTDQERIHERQLEQFLNNQKVIISLPAHFFVRRSELGTLIRIDSPNGSRVIRKENSSGNYSIVGLK